ncbi:hypothetical protein FO519_008828 [Halicephalobus sp. NKZ332]|nr:hypothetical protein FO519_008828 [Halicephalobus sp. NKZ332]
MLTTIIIMFYRGRCKSADYFMFIRSLYSCYGILTSPMTAKCVLEQIRDEHRIFLANTSEDMKEEINETGFQKGVTGELDEAAKFSVKDISTDSCGNSLRSDLVVQTNGSNSNNPSDHSGDNSFSNTPKNDEEKENINNKLNGKSEARGTATQGINKVFSRFRDTRNEYVVEKELIRRVENCNDVREIFCEVAFTNTTVDLKNGILLVNGQLNVDGACLGRTIERQSADQNNVANQLGEKIRAEREHILCNDEARAKSDREILFIKKNKHNIKLQEIEAEKTIQLSKTEIEEERKKIIQNAKTERREANKLFNKCVIEAYTRSYRLVSEPEVRQVNQILKGAVGTDLRNITINGKQPFQNTTPVDYFRIQQCLIRHELLSLTEFQRKLIAINDICLSDIYDEAQALGYFNSDLDKKSNETKERPLQRLGAMSQEGRQEHVEKFHSNVQRYLEGKNLKFREDLLKATETIFSWTNSVTTDDFAYCMDIVDLEAQYQARNTSDSVAARQKFIEQIANNSLAECQIIQQRIDDHLNEVKITLKEFKEKNTPNMYIFNSSISVMKRFQFLRRLKQS